MALGQYDGSIRINTSLETKDFNASLGKISNSVKKFGASVGIAFGVSSLIKFGKEAINLASDVQEVQNVVDTAFGSMSGMVEDFASTAIEKFGMSELAAKQTASTYMAMSKGMGMYGKEAAQMAIDAAARTGDIASFYNMTQKEADTMLKSIWTGETESLKRIGVVMTQTNLDQYALQKGFGKTTSAMNQQELTLLRYQYVMDKTNLAAGDFEKTQDSWANQTRVLTERWKQFLSLMGTGLIQMLTPALKFLNQMMSVLLRFADAFSKVTEALFGKQTLSTAQGAESSISGVAGATDDYADATANAKKQQDKFLAGLDEITTLNEKNDTPSAPSAIGGMDMEIHTFSGEIGGDVTISPALQKVIDKLKEFTGGLKEIDLSPLKQSLNNLWKALEPFAEPIAQGLEWLWNTVLLPMARWTIEDYLPNFLNALSGALRVLNPLLEIFIPLWEWLYEWFWEPMLQDIGDDLIEVLKSLGIHLDNLGGWIDEHKPELEKILKIVSGIFTAIFIGWLKSENPLLQTIGSFSTLSKTVGGARKEIEKAFNKLSNVAKPAINGLLDNLERGINCIINGLNKLIISFNRLSFDVPDWVPGIGGKKFGLNIREIQSVHIPRLATGAVIPPNAEFAAILGDQKHGRNLEAPEGLIRQIVKEESGANLTVILQMQNGEEKEVFSSKHISKINRQSGRILIPITEV